MGITTNKQKGVLYIRRDVDRWLKPPSYSEWVYSASRRTCFNLNRFLTKKGVALFVLGDMLEFISASVIIKKLMQFFAYSKLWFIAGFNL